jgi:rhamnosyltransferase
MKKKDFCILLAAHNGERFIKKQLLSILQQQNVTLDIFVNIDRSEDNTKSIVFRLKKKFPNIKVLNNNKKFGSASKNFFYLIKKVNFNNYNFISFSDQDDIWMKKKLFIAKKICLKKNLDGYASNTFAFGFKEGIIYKNQKFTKYDYLFEGGGPGHTIVITRKIADLIKKKIKTTNLKKINYYDWFIYFFVRANEGKWYIDKNYYTYYRQHNSNEIGANLNIKSFLKRTKVLLTSDLLNESRNYSSITGILRRKDISIIYQKNFTSFFYVIKNFYEFRRKNFDKLIFLFAYIVLFLRKF